MSSFVKPLLLAAWMSTAAACAGVGSEAVGPVATPEAPRATRTRTPLVYEGTWHLAVDGARYTLALADGAATLRAEGDGIARPVEDVRWDAATGRLTFRALVGSGYGWFDGFVAGPVVRGRVARNADGPPRPEGYTGQFTGWNADLVDAARYPRVFDLSLSDGRRARLRLDRPASEGAAPVSTFKVYGSVARASADEEPEYPANVSAWDGHALAFRVDYASGPVTFVGAVDGRLGRGAASVRGGGSFTWTATRAEVLSHGLAARSLDEQRTWADQTRRALARLMMDGAPAPAYATVTPVSTGLSPIRPLTREPAGMLPQAYTLGQVRITLTLRDPRGGADGARAVTAWVARPSTPPPARGYPLVVALNGHNGSAVAVMDPNNTLYGYGDAYARNGFVVVAVDVSHRPVADRAALYADVVDGDEPRAGNGTHPAVRHGALSTAWEEDGERAWDVSRALDYALQLPNVDRARVAVTGLSMGAEVATFVGALDPRFTTVIPAGFSPDLNVLAAGNGNHPCWRWAGGDITEYVDTSDVHALIAPRTLLVETGALDRLFSRFMPPFAGDKQVMRRARVAWADPGRVVHFLHGGAHVYRVGDPFFDKTSSAGITVFSVTAPEGSNPLAWQFDPSTTTRATSVFEFAAGLRR